MRSQQQHLHLFLMQIIYDTIHGFVFVQLAFHGIHFVGLCSLPAVNFLILRNTILGIFKKMFESFSLCHNLKPSKNLLLVVRRLVLNSTVCGSCIDVMLLLWSKYYPPTEIF